MTHNCLWSSEFRQSAELVLASAQLALGNILSSGSAVTSVMPISQGGRFVAPRQCAAVLLQTNRAQEVQWARRVGREKVY